MGFWEAQQWFIKNTKAKVSRLKVKYYYPPSSSKLMKSVAAGKRHFLVLSTDGLVWAWGWSIKGRNDPKRSLTMVNGLSGVQAIAAEDSISVVLKTDGTVWMWSWDSCDNRMSNSMEEGLVQIKDITNARAIACGYKHSLILKRMERYGLGDATNLGRLVI